MAIETERKFLVKSELWIPQSTGEELAQGYLECKQGFDLRVRQSSAAAHLTLKFGGVGLSRDEFEYEIPISDAAELLRRCGSRVVLKTRHKHHVYGKEWIVDLFHGSNAGLIVAEIELCAPTEHFTPPIWIGREVTFDERFRNAYLAQNPFVNWPLSIQQAFC